MDFSIGGIGAAYNKNDVSENTSKLEESLKSDLSNATDKELMEVCKDFEAYFTEQMFKSMQKMIPKSEDNVSAYTKQMQEFYKEQMVQTFADNSAEGQSLGIAQILYEQMKRNYGLE